MLTTVSDLRAVICAAALFLLIICADSGRCRADTPPTPDSIEFFEKQVRPLLADQCLGCHGPAAASANGGLRMGGLTDLLKGGGRGPAIVVGNPESSLLIKAIAYTDRSLAMPPRGRLTDGQIQILTDWIRRGAPWPGKAPATGAAPASGVFDLKARKASHWAWQTVKYPHLPIVKSRSWSALPIDAFILAKLEAKGIAPAKAADKRTLIRRVTFDLVGLPPTPDEVRAFLADNSPNAYAKVVDRLLASPHYGERWARHWLDLVRYAETDGHEFDLEKPGAYQYRDYVIRAFNADLSYKQFAMEQIAGDLLATPRLNPVDRYNESILGTGFYWLGSGTHSPVDLLDDQADHMDNEIDVLTKTFVGIGVACARCHDHKFDAVSQKDYYGLFGILKTTRRQIVTMCTPPSSGVLRDLAAVRADMDRVLLATARSAVQSGAGLNDPGWKPAIAAAKSDVSDVLYPLACLADIPVQRFDAEKRAVLAKMRDQAARAQHEESAIDWFAGPGATSPAGWMETGAAFGDITRQKPNLDVRLSADSNPHVAGAFCASVGDSGLLSDRLNGDVRSRTFTIDKPRILYRMAGRGARLRLVVDGLLQLRDPLYGGLNIELDSDTLKWYEQDVSRWIGHRAYVELQDLDSGYIALDRVGFSAGRPPATSPNSSIVDLLDSPGVSSLKALHSAYKSRLASVLDDSGAANGPAQRVDEELRAWAVRCAPIPAGTSSVLAELVRHRSTLEKSLTSIGPALAAADGTGENERVHMRGNYRTLGANAPRRFLEACDGPLNFERDPGCGRLQLAERITSASDPLFARVMVNRLWQHHFGEGIVRTPDDFGFMGQRPSHPELLDWLATEFVRGKWSIKRMQRMMVMTATYRMDSRSDAKSDAADPQNLLLHRMPLRRLEAECIRDSILAVSGRLDSKVCGPPVMPHLSDNTPGRGAPASGPVDGDGRRSIYISVRRGFPVPMLSAFDLPVPMTTMGRRTVSSVPAQALTLLNDPFVVEQSAVWAKRVVSSPGSVKDRIAEMYETAYSRPPDARELSTAATFIESRTSTNTDDAQAWSDLCHVLFNVKEFIFVR